jgi:hypothetical protein
MRMRLLVLSTPAEKKQFGSEFGIKWTESGVVDGQRMVDGRQAGAIASTSYQTVGERCSHQPHLSSLSKCQWVVRGVLFLENTPAGLALRPLLNPGRSRR